jgi:hypothetical protein
MKHTPFIDKTEYLTFKNIENHKYYIDETLDESVIDIIKNILVKDYKLRLGYNCKTIDMDYSVLKSHKLFSKFISDGYLDGIKQCFDKSIFERRTDYSSISQSDKSVTFVCLDGKDKVLKEGILKKKSPWLYYDKRKLILYSTPRIDYFEPDTGILKGSILLTKCCKTELVDSTKFNLITPNRTYTFMWKKQYDISPWVLAINDAIINYAQ